MMREKETLRREKWRAEDEKRRERDDPIPGKFHNSFAEEEESGEGVGGQDKNCAVAAPVAAAQH